MVARLARIRDENSAVTRGAQCRDAAPDRAAHGARHARSAESPAASRPTPLSIRSAERRRWSADVARPGVTALVLHGMGGIGKSTLATQIASRVTRLGPERVVTVLSGEMPAARLVAEAAEADLVVLDDFDDYLAGPERPRTVRDPALAALLASWTGKLLITCDTPFSLPGAAPGRFVFRRLGPLTRSGAGELSLSLPALRQLAESQRELAWRLTGGHPRAMEHLDALLATSARFEDVADRVAVAVQDATGQRPARTRLTELPEPTELPEAAAEVVAVAAGQQLLGELFSALSAGARDLLVRASVFRTPVEPGVLAARPANVAECTAAGLLATGPGDQLSVHRWTASELHRSLAAAGQAVELGTAHREAAAYWQARIGTPQLGSRAQLEAGHHLRQAADLTSAPGHPRPRPGAARPSVSSGRGRLRRLGVASVAGAVVAFLAVEATGGLSTSHLAAAAGSDQAAVPATLEQASAVRDQAAAWVASEVSASAIIACDPVMCSVLVRHGVPAADLLVLGPGASDPLGSALVVATAAVRAMFGTRLATVYAPQTLASFGSGAARIDLRVIAPDGAAAYRTALAADLRARQVAGLQLAADPRVSVRASARSQLAGGSVDERLLITLAALAGAEPVRIIAFADDGPGSSPGTPLRTAELAAPEPAARAMLAFLRAQRPPFLPARADLSRGPVGLWTLTMQFTAPSPLGLLSGPS
jgi:hypothetical protein